MRIGIALPTLVDGDAVGNDAFGMARVLRRRGHDVQFFAWNSRVSEPVKGPEELMRTLNRPDDVLIYHHSIGCEWAVKAMEKLPCRKAVKYHNVTPPQFFKSLNKEIAAGCAQGIREVSRLARTNAHIWADSEYNSNHVREVQPGRKVTELPPFHQADLLLNAEPDFRAVMGLDDWATNILLVGRLVPNKNVPLAVKAFAEYRAGYDSRARLIIVGDRPVPKHSKEVDDIIVDRGQEGHVMVTGKVTVPQLKALYLTSDMLLVTSLHEGFCVPLIEAMGLLLPVVAVPNAAVPFTGGDAALYANADPKAIAEQMHRLLSQASTKETHIARGQQRYAKEFTNQAIEKRFEMLFDELMAEPVK